MHGQGSGAPGNCARALCLVPLCRKNSLVLLELNTFADDASASRQDVNPEEDHDHGPYLKEGNVFVQQEVREDQTEHGADRKYDRCGNCPETLQALDAQVRRAAEDEDPKEEYVDHFCEARRRCMEQESDQKQTCPGNEGLDLNYSCNVHTFRDRARDVVIDAPEESGCKNQDVPRGSEAQI